MAHNKSEDTSFRDLVARLNAMHNLTPEQERQSLIESVGQAPKVLDDKEVTLADIAKLAGIKEYVAPVKHSKKAEKMVESITAEPKLESSIAKAIKESDADVSISKQIKEAVTKASNRLDKIAELEYGTGTQSELAAGIAGAALNAGLIAIDAQRGEP